MENVLWTPLGQATAVSATASGMASIVGGGAEGCCGDIVGG
jgi:hypothetical protein